MSASKLRDGDWPLRIVPQFVNESLIRADDHDQYDNR